MKKIIIILVTLLPCHSFAEKIALSDLPPDIQSEINSQKEDLWRYFSAGFLVNVYSDDIVNSAEIRDEKVRIVDSQKTKIGVGLQAYFPFYKLSYVISTDKGKTWVKGSEVSVGLYSGVMVDSTNIIDNFSVGLAYSHRRTFGGLRIGIGYAFDPSVQRLSDEFVNGEPAPVGETQIRYKNESSGAIQLMVSFTSGW